MRPPVPSRFVEAEGHGLQLGRYLVMRRIDFEANDASLAQSARFFDGPYGAYLVLSELEPPDGFVEIP